MELIFKGEVSELFAFQSVQKAPTEEPSCTPNTPNTNQEQRKDMIEALELQISDLKNEAQSIKGAIGTTEHYLLPLRNRNVSIEDITKLLEENLSHLTKKEQNFKEQIAARERRILILKNSSNPSDWETDMLERLMNGYIDKGPIENTLRYFGYEEDSGKIECRNHWSKYEYLEKLSSLPKMIHSYLKDKKFKLVFDYDPSYPNTLIQIFRE